MRKGLLALGIIFLFLGLVFISISREPIKPEPILTEKWVNVDEARDTRAFNLTVQGDLDRGDRFKVSFGLARTQAMDPEPEIRINISDPDGNTMPYTIPIGVDESGAFGLLGEPPEELANVTGNYKVFAAGVFVFLNYLSLQKWKLDITEKEAYYPNSNLFPVGIVVVVSGGGVSLLGAKISKPKKTRNKR